ncbi:hypothetical protein IWX87_003214, partial [Polaromonas sp. CG_9.7]|nr:hypothetical protein [Polaromonas sp. CG_9.7]MBG6115374.1 hypothetical protein [Polaromonas sp. CG_9.2]
EQKFHNASALSEKSTHPGRVLRLPAEYFSSLLKEKNQVLPIALL